MCADDEDDERGDWQQSSHCTPLLRYTGECVCGGGGAHSTAQLLRGADYWYLERVNYVMLCYVVG